jgi:hypothetical protein
VTDGQRTYHQNASHPTTANGKTPGRSDEFHAETAHVMGTDDAATASAQPGRKPAHKARRGKRDCAAYQQADECIHPV